MGGKEKAEVISVSKIVREQNQYRCFVKNKMIVNDLRIKYESYLFGIYNEKDLFWCFFEAK